MAMRPSTRIQIILCFALIPSFALAIGEAESEDGNYSIEAIGSGRVTGAALHFPDIPELFPVQDEWLLAAVARLILEGDLGPRMDYEVNFYTDLSRVPPAYLGGAFATAGSFESPYRYKYLKWDFWEDGSAGGQLGPTGGYLYAADLAGAAGGALLAGLLVLPLYGVVKTLLLLVLLMAGCLIAIIRRPSTWVPSPILRTRYRSVTTCRCAWCSPHRPTCAGSPSTLFT